ncbi:MAG: slipin family protein [Planctomycetes bacterium]|nr:slipin family protein [Planctomycetota bacterium]MBL7185220.1 slipin family protein [Phycisphaerae bacterium]
MSKLTREYEESARAKTKDANITWVDVKEPGINWVALLVASVVGLAGSVVNRLVAGDWLAMNAAVVVPTTLLSALCLFSIKIANQWERVIVLRLGNFSRLKGPGPFLMIPIIETLAQVVDMRIRSTDFSSESTLTKDTVPVDVDAICFWMVWDAKKAILEVQNFYLAIVLSAQTALRDIIGTHKLDELLTHREQLGKRLREILDEKTNPWGTTVQSVEIRDIIIPKGLEDAMSKQAQAERERQARIILATAETEIAANFAEAAKQYESNPGPMHLRGMNMLFEGLKEKGSMIIVPSSALETMNLGAIGGLTAFGQARNIDAKD